ncbi:MAG: FixH family protein [Cellvibrionales bacterium]|nr:FixH family protein [Cellvibrionales bacterium]
MTEQHSPKPWYRQFWPWFLLTPLIMTVCLSSYMLRVAFTQDQAVVSDNYYKNGLAINKLMEDLAAAKAMGIKARITFDDEKLLLALSAVDDLPQDLSVSLVFSHPISRKKDVAVKLQAVGNHQFVGQLPTLDQGKWYLDIESSVSQSLPAWRLKKTVFAPFKEISLD